MFTFFSIFSFLGINATVNSLSITDNSSSIGWVTFEEWCSEYQMPYCNNPQSDEYIYRSEIYYINLKNMIPFNHNKNNSYTKGINQYSAMTSDEFKYRYLSGIKLPNKTELNNDNIFEGMYNENNPIDWCVVGGCTPIQDQKMCGSCWSFSATRTLETTWFIYYNELPKLSEQQNVDCVQADYGCDGGWPKDAIHDIMHRGGQDSEKSYPYLGYDGNPCNFTKEYVLADALNVKVIPEGNETALLAAIQQGPVSVGIDASGLQNYNRGIFDGDCSNDPEEVDHAVVVVGYGFMNYKNATIYYYKLANSWNVSWGDQGFFYFPVGVNKCGVANYGITIGE